MSRLAAGVLVALVLATTGCGLKGPLYLPEKSEVTIRPAPAAGAGQPAEPAATEAPTAPETPATPETPPEDPPSTGPGRE